MRSTILTILLLASFSLALPAPEAEETDGEVSRKVLGSSVVTSVSVIMDVGNGSQTYFSDAVGKPMNKPSAATQLASPINLLNPDRYEFYTFDDSGDLVKRLMTLDEIQGIIASGDGEAMNYNSQALTGDMPEKKVDDVVNNVQNVLKEEMEAHKTSPELKPTFDTPDVTSTWNLILPAIFGNSAGDIIPDKSQNGATAETIMIEPTTLLPVMQSEDSQPQVVPSDSTKHVPTTIVPDSASESTLQESKTESIPGKTDAPVITVEITSTNKQNLSSEVQNDEVLSSKTENPYTTSTEIKSTTQFVLENQTIANESLKIASSTSYTKGPESTTTMLPVTSKLETMTSAVAPLLTTIAKVTMNDKENYTVPTSSYTTPMASASILSELDTSSTTHFYKKTSPAQSSTASQSTTNLPAASTTQLGQLSTFFLIQDLKERPESTTKAYLRPLPFTSMNTEMTKISTSQQKPETTTRNYMRPSPFTLPSTIMTKIDTIKPSVFKTTTPELYTTATEENPAKEDTKGYLPLDIVRSSTPKVSSTQTTSASIQTESSTKLYTTTTTTPTTITTTTDKKQFTSTEPMTTIITTKPYLQTSTTEEDLKPSTTESETLQPSTMETVTENISAKISNISITTNNQQSLQAEESSTLEQVSTSEESASTVKLPVTELLNQLLLTTDIHQINSELLSDVDVTTSLNNGLETSTIYNEPTTLNSRSTTGNQNEASTFASATQKPENDSLPTTDANLMSSIEQLISQAVGKPEEPIDNIKESEKVNQMMLNTNSKPMSQVQVETATAASALLGTPITESASTVTIMDEKVNQAVDSLISQIIYQQPSQTTIEDYSTTTDSIVERSTTESGITSTSGEDLSFTTQSTTLDSTEPSTTVINSNYSSNSIIDIDDDRNRYEEIDLGVLDSTTTIKYEAKTIPPLPILLSNFNQTSTINQNLSSYERTTEEPLVDTTTSTELNQQETSYPSTINLETYSTTERLIQDSTLSTQQYFEESANSVNPNIQNISNSDFKTSTESLKEATSKSNEILNSEATELKQNYNEASESSSEPFLILAVGSSEYPDYTSTENLDISTKSIEYDSTTSGEVKENTETTAESQTHAEISTQEDLLKYITSTTEEADFHTTENYFNPSLNNNTTTLFTEKVDLTTTQLSSTTSTAVPSTSSSTTTTSSHATQTQAFVNIATVTAAPKIEKPPELKLIVNNTSSTTTQKPDTTWTLVSTVLPHKTTVSDEGNKPPHNPESAVDLVPKPLQGFGLEDSTSALDTDVFQFTELCNELAFSFWSSVTSGISFARSVIVSPFAATSMLAMVFLGARGSTSGEMNDILKLDDMVTFNPHGIFKNVIESIEVSKKSGVATSVFVKELYSDKNKGKLLSFYKERVKQFYDGHVEEINFREINDVIRRRTNLLVKRQTWGKIPEYLKDNSLFVRPPLAAVSANIFQTDCSGASTEGRDGELHFVVLPSIRQRKLIPIPAVVWRSGFLAGYDPGLDATAVAIGGKDQTISTIFVIPGQQGISAPGDGLVRLEARLIESAFRQGAWSRLLRSLIPRPGLEVQIPRFSHKSVINATSALQRMGLKDLFNSNTADLKGLNGVAHELYLSDIVQVNTFATCGEGRIDETHHSEVYPATTNRSFRRIRKIQHYHHGDKPFENGDLSEEPRDYQRAFHDPLYDPSFLALPLQLRPRQARLPDAPRLRFDRPFLYFVRHNPTGLIIHMGRFNPRLLP